MGDDKQLNRTPVVDSITRIRRCGRSRPLEIGMAKYSDQSPEERYSDVERFVRQYLSNGRIGYNTHTGYCSHVTPIQKTLEDVGWSVEKVEKSEWKSARYRLLAPDSSMELWLNGSRVSRHPRETTLICERKELTRKMLSLAGVPIPLGADFSPNEMDFAAIYFSRIQKPAVLKPSNSGASKGVTTGVYSAASFAEAWEKAANAAGRSGRVIIERQAKGLELRVLVVGDSAVAVIARVQPYVEGDGEASIAELIGILASERSDFFRARQFESQADWDFVAQRGLGPGSVPSRGEIVLLNPFSTTVVGGSLVDVTDYVSDDIKRVCVEACRAIPNLEIGGVDILVRDLSDSTNAVVLEVNTAPAHNLHRYPTHGEPREVGIDIANYFHRRFLRESNSVHAPETRVVSDSEETGTISAPTLVAQGKARTRGKGGTGEVEEIRFSNLEIDQSRVSVNASTGSDAYPLWFEFDRQIQPSANAVAVALSTLCGNRFGQITYDFDIGSNIADGIAEFCQADVECHRSDRWVRKGNGSSILSFSGGFDSLAAMRLVGDDVGKVSLDFGGWFKREAAFFRQFDSVVVSTNCRRTPDQKNSLARNHWTFMAIGAILTAEYFGASHHVFGTILGESFARPARPKQIPPLELMNLQNVPVTDGITELGTAKVLLQTDAERVSESIASLAGSTDRKRLLKIALAHAVSDEMGVDAKLPKVPRDWSKKIRFDSSYTTALSAMYMIGRDKAHLIEPLYESIPSEVYELSRSLDLEFLMKVNWDFYTDAPLEHLVKIAPRLMELGFLPYSERDWKEAEQLRSFLNGVFDF